MGVKKTGDFLEKATWVAIIGILALSLGSNLFIDTNNTGGPVSPNLENTQAAPAPLPTLDNQSSTLPVDELTDDSGDSTSGN